MKEEQILNKLDIEKEELSLKDLFLKIYEWLFYLKGKWLTILVGVVLGCFLGLTYSLLKKPDYTAESTFVLEDGGNTGGLSQYAGIASMIGIDIGGSSNGIFQGDNIIELYRSKTMLRKTLLSFYLGNGIKERLIDRYILFNNIRKHWKNKPELQNISFNLAKGNTFTRLQDSLINEFIKDIRDKNLIVNKPDKKLSIIRVVVIAKDEVFAKAFNDNLVKDVNDFYVQTRTKKSLENLKILQHQTDSVRAVLNGAIYTSAATIDATPNLNPTRQILRAPMQKSQINAEANKAILSELIKNLELSNITLRKEIPLIKIIDQPIFPLENNKIKAPVGIVSGGILFFFLIIFFLTLSRFYRRVMGTN